MMKLKVVSSCKCHRGGYEDQPAFWEGFSREFREMALGRLPEFVKEMVVEGS